MLQPVIEPLVYAIGEFIGFIIFYNTGAIVIRIFTFGKTKFPIFGPGIGKENPLPKVKYGIICYLSGIAFYVLLISILIIILKNITS